MATSDFDIDNHHNSIKFDQKKRKNTKDFSDKKENRQKRVGFKQYLQKIKDQELEDELEEDFDEHK
jgi:hypothetical protein